MSEITITIKLRDDSTATATSIAEHLLDTFNDDGSIEHVTDDTPLRRAANLILAFCDFECDFYDAQSSVEDWALTALELALAGRNEQAIGLMDKYEPAEWEAEEEGEVSRSAYAYDEEEEATA